MITTDTDVERQSLRICGCDCRGWTGWRGQSLSNRVIWKAICSLLLILYCGWYFSLVYESAALVFIGATFLIKLLVEIWGQHTPTWAAPGTPTLLIVIYVFGIPSLISVYGLCRKVDDLDLGRGRNELGLLLYVFGSAYSLGYEVHRFRWKAQPENKGKLHTIGLARFCVRGCEPTDRTHDCTECSRTLRPPTRRRPTLRREARTGLGLSWVRPRPRSRQI